MTSKLLHYIVEFEDGSHFDVHVNPADSDDVHVDGVPRGVRVEAGSQGTWVTTEEGQRVPLQLRYEHGELVVETSDGQKHRVKVELARSAEFKRQVLSQPPPPAPEHDGRLEAPIAGSILKLLVEEGTVVAEGDGVILLEAMKMQNTILAPASGVIAFFVKPGQTVRNGDLMATLTPVGSKS